MGATTTKKLASAALIVSSILLASAGQAHSFPGFSATWCGTPRATDDQVNETGTLNDAKIHVVYAYPSDSTNMFSAYDDVIQADISAIADKIDAQAGSTKSIRFDLGTDGGLGCVDITTVALPDTKAFYEATGSGAFGKVAEDVAPVFGLSRPIGTIPPRPRDIMVYADMDPAGTIAGSGDQYADDSATGNYHDYGGLISVMYNSGGRFGLTDATDVANRRLAALHEAGHNLGAVQGIGGQPTPPPNASGGGHCHDEYDIMCYVDSGPYFTGGGVLTFPGGCGSATDQLFDCGQDDYFDPTETAATYLATHWNLYDSAFMCSVSPATACVPDELAPSRTLTVTPAGTGSGVVIGPGISCPSDCSHLYVNGDGVSMTPTAATGSVFTGWSGACTGTGGCSITMDGDKALTATFTSTAPPPPPAGGGTTATAPTAAATAPAPVTKKKKKKKKKKKRKKK